MITARCPGCSTVDRPAVLFMTATFAHGESSFAESSFKGERPRFTTRTSATAGFPGVPLNNSVGSDTCRFSKARTASDSSDRIRKNIFERSTVAWVSIPTSSSRSIPCTYSAAASRAPENPPRDCSSRCRAAAIIAWFTLVSSVANMRSILRNPSSAWRKAYWA